MPDPNEQGQDVNNPDPNSGAGAGASAGGAGDQVTDQELEIALPSGEKKKVKVSDIFDEKGVPFKNRHHEATRRLEETSTELDRIKATQFQEKATQESGEPATSTGKYKDPTTGEVVTEEDLNRMFMTGEGAKAQRIILSNVDVKGVVKKALVEQDVKVRTVSRYPDLANPKSEFFQRTAKYMAEENLYGTPNGLALAASAAAEEMREAGLAFTEGTGGRGPEGQRNSQTNAGVVEGDGGRRGAPATVELDEAGKLMASKLGIDPEKMKARLQQRLAGRRV